MTVCYNICRVPKSWQESVKSFKLQMSSKQTYNSSNGLIGHLFQQVQQSYSSPSWGKKKQTGSPTKVLLERQNDLVQKSSQEIVWILFKKPTTEGLKVWHIVIKKSWSNLNITFLVIVMISIVKFIWSFWPKKSQCDKWGTTTLPFTIWL